MEIVGVGFDPPEETAPWAEEQGYTYQLWTDLEKTLALTYGSITDPEDSTPGRMTVVLDPDGVLFLEYLDSVVVTTHPAQVLSDLEQLL